MPTLRTCSPIWGNCVLPLYTSLPNPNDLHEVLIALSAHLCVYLEDGLATWGRRVRLCGPRSLHTVSWHSHRSLGLSQPSYKTSGRMRCWLSHRLHGEPGSVFPPWQRASYISVSHCVMLGKSVELGPRQWPLSSGSSLLLTVSLFLLSSKTFSWHWSTLSPASESLPFYKPDGSMFKIVCPSSSLDTLCLFRPLRFRRLEMLECFLPGIPGLGSFSLCSTYSKCNLLSSAFSRLLI